MTNYFNVTGSGPAVVFLHAALADRRMWQPQVEQFSATHTVITIDMRGFGDRVPATEPYSSTADVLTTMDNAGVDHATLVGNSMGARVAAQAALTAPSRVRGLVLIGPAFGSHDWSQQTQDLWRLEEAALEEGNIERAVEVNLDYWLDGPNRDRANLSPQQRDLVTSMQRRAFELEVEHPNAARETRFGDFDERLPEIAVPTRVLYGTEDAADIATIASQIARVIEPATLHAIEDTGHLPTFEAPDVCNDHIAAVLAASA